MMHDDSARAAVKKPPFFTRGRGFNYLRKIFDHYKRKQIELLRKEFAEYYASKKSELVDILRIELQRVIEAQQQTEVTFCRNISYATQKLAALETARFVQQYMPHVQSFSHRDITMNHALALAPKGGLALEFGVYKGTTLRIIAQARQGQRVYGFDSFKGLPEDWRNGFATGAFAIDQLPHVDGAKLVVGWFDETLPQFLKDHNDTIDFLHIDCDLYSSAKTVLELVGPRLRPGSIIIFDEFFNYPGWQEHEFRAWDEYSKSNNVLFNYEAFTVDHEQVVLRIL